jgi:hypothetical protein
MSVEVTAKRVWLRFHLPSEVPRVGRVIRSVPEAVGQAAAFEIYDDDVRGIKWRRWQIHLTVRLSRHL